MKITLLPGDGIGVEIVDAAVEVLDAAAKKFGMAIEYDRQLIGGAAIDAARSTAAGSYHCFRKKLRRRTFRRGRRTKMG